MNTQISLLEIPTANRNQTDTEKLIRLASCFKFFQDLFERQGTLEMTNNICKNLTVSHYSPGQFIFRTGDQPDKYYFLLRGTVKIMSNKYVEMEDPGDDEIHRLIRKNTEATHVRAKKSKDSPPEMQMGILNPGDAFGEAAIINDKPRYFSVIANENVTVATLHKTDYFKLEGNQEKQISEKVEFLRTIDAFKTWSRVSLYNLSFYFKELKYIRGTVVYKEGDIPNVIYLIKEGEFKFTQRFSINVGSKYSVNKGGKGNSGLLSTRNSTIRTKDLQVVTKQQGEMFGFEEIFDKLPQRLFTCTCISQTGKLFYISEKNFTKKVAHPESLKIIDEQCKTFRNWIYPRLEELKNLELFKDDNSYTPYQKIKLTPRSSTTNSAHRPLNYTEYISDSQPLPLILKKILTAKHEESLSSRKKSRTNAGNFSMFQTEFEDVDRRKSSKFNTTFIFENSRKSCFIPTKLSKRRIKKTQTSII